MVGRNKMFWLKYTPVIDSVAIDMEYWYEFDGGIWRHITNDKMIHVKNNSVEMSVNWQARRASLMVW